MKKWLLSIFAFFTILFINSYDIKALPSGSSYTTQTEIARFYTTIGSIKLYGNNGTNTSCGTISSPSSNASLDCFKNQVLSLSTIDTSMGGNNTSMRFLSPTPIVSGNTYRVTINYTLSSSSYSNIKNHWKIDYGNYELISFNSNCSDVKCKVQYVVKSLEDSDYVWLQGNNSSTTYTFQTFNSYVSYMHLPVVEDLTNDPNLFEEINPSVTMLESAEELGLEVSGLINKIYTADSTSLTNGKATYEYIHNIFMADEVFKEYGEYYVCSGSASAYTTYCYISDNPDVFTIGYGYTGSINSPTATYFTLGLNIGLEDKVYKYAISSGSYNSSSSGYVTSSQNIRSLISSDVIYIPTNVTYFKMQDPVYNTIKTSDGYTFNDGNIILYQEGASFVVNTDYKTSLTPEVNIFDREIDDIDYFKMIFTFDVNALKENNNVFDYLIDFESIGSIQDDNTINESHIQKFGRPYIEYVDKDGVLRTLEIDFGYDDQKSTRSAWYVSQYQSISSEISSFKLILPMDETAYSRYRIRFVSYIPFEVSYVTNEEALSYYENVDLTNKYGVIFMPKLVENKSDISSIFYTTGIESVLVYASYDLKESPIEVYDSDLSEFKYSISYENINYNLVFKVNPLTPELGIVTYDTRYYTYKIIDSKYSVGTVINPNTGDKYYIDFSNTNNVSIDFENVGDVFNFIGEKLDSSGASYSLFVGSLNAFFNTMPSDIYIFILVVVALILLGTTLILGGWK